MTEYIYHAYDPMFGGFNPPIPALRKHRYEKKNSEKVCYIFSTSPTGINWFYFPQVIFVRPSTQFNTSSFLTSVTEQLSTTTTPPTGILLLLKSYEFD